MAKGISIDRPQDNYWATLPQDEVGEQIYKSVHDFYQWCAAGGRLYLWRSCYEHWNKAIEYGATVNEAGEVGELTVVHFNHFRNVITHMANLTLAQRPNFQPRSTNTDYSSQSQVQIAKSILDYELNEKELESTIREAANLALTYGDAAVHIRWDQKSGEEVTRPVQDPESGEVVNEVVYDESGDPVTVGDVVYKAIPSYDLIRDVNRSTIADPNWIIVRDYVNKWDLIAQYANVDQLEEPDIEEPDRDQWETTDEMGNRTFDQEGYEAAIDEYQAARQDFDETLSYLQEVREGILNTENKSKTHTEYRVAQETTIDSDEIPVYHFYHKRCPSLPSGRYVYCTEEGQTILEDTDLPYSDIPVYELYPGETTGQPFGYSFAFDILAPQDILDMLHSSIITNQRAFGVQSIIVPQSANISAPQLVGGMNFIPYVPDATGGKPEALQLTSTPAEVFQYAAAVEQQIETLSGINSVVRGNPESNLKSGSALALMASQALQFTDTFNKSYVHCLEQVGSAIIDMYQTYAHAPRTMAIVGKSKQPFLQEFTGDDIADIDRVQVDVGSAMANTVAGKMEIAQNLFEMGLVKTPEQYLQVMSTGQLDPLIEGDTAELMSIRNENEYLSRGEAIQAMVTDNHITHIMEHKTVLASPSARQNPEVVKATTDHLMAHIMMLKDPNLAELNALMGQPALAAGPAEGGPQQLSDAQAANAGQMADVVGAPATAAQEAADVEPANMPKMPENPLTGETVSPAAAPPPPGVGA